MRLLYVMDPMCAWCYGFQPELESFLVNHSSTKLDWVMGGLAPDTKIPMDEELKQRISSYWHQIETHSQVTFNHQYWQSNTPYRSTYPACRAVISSEKLAQNGSYRMVKAIQSAYYLEAKNPSLEDTLLECACTLGIDTKEFTEVLKSEDTERELQQHLSIGHQLQVTGFPALFYIDDGNRAQPLALGFCKASDIEQRLAQIKEPS